MLRSIVLLTALLASTSAFAKAVECVGSLVGPSCNYSESASAIEQRKRAEQIRVEDLPVNRVLNGYILFFLVKVCHDKSKGDLLTYVDDIELRRAERVIKAIIDKAKLDDATINAPAQWKRAVKLAKRLAVSDIECLEVRDDLFARSPFPLFNVDKP